MKDDSNQNRPREQVNYIWLLAGFYLIYTAIRLFQRLFSGETENILINIGGGVVFVAVGVLMLVREWQAYRRGKARRDAPEEPEEDSGEGDA